MKGDFSKLRFDRKRNFSGVLHQQGRVLLDADWNARDAIIGDWQDQAGADIIGPCVAAVPAAEPTSFEIASADRSDFSTTGSVSLEVRPGRVWADGILAILYGDEDDPSAPLPFEATFYEDPSAGFPTDARDAVILEVWREAINGFQMVDELIEPALGGIDTTERKHTSFDFRLLRLEEGDTCENICDKLKSLSPGDGKLTVTLKESEPGEEPCPLEESGGYTGFEHYLYRIEIAHLDSATVGDSVPRFKWSWFNGGLVGRGTYDGADDKITITANNRAIASTGLNEFYLEVVEFDESSTHTRITFGATFNLVENELVLDTEYFGDKPTGGDEIFFRLWNGIEKIDDYPKSADPEEFRDGICLAFHSTDQDDYLPGDYWTFTVRAGKVEQKENLIGEIDESDNVIGELPHGIEYHRVPLAILNWGGEEEIEWGDAIDDCRKIFHPLVDLHKWQGCCTRIVGDGHSSHGDYDDIQEAIDSLPQAGGILCLMPGLHTTNAVIAGQCNIKITGCGDRTRVIPKEKGPLFHIKSSVNISLENMQMVTLSGEAVYMEEVSEKPGSLRGIEICTNKILALSSAVRDEGGVDIGIRGNDILMLDDSNGEVAIFMKAEDSIIEGNSVITLPADIDSSSELPKELLEILDAGLKLAGTLKEKDFIENFKKNLECGITQLWDLGRYLVPQGDYKTPGGIQIGGDSERIVIAENLIAGGSWNGITLGHIPVSGDVEINVRLWEKGYFDDAGKLPPNLNEDFRSYIEDLRIEDNEIRNMGLNGIGIVGYFDLKEFGLLVTAVDLTIRRNTIEKCVQQLSRDLPLKMSKEMGFGGIALSDCEQLIIRENRIENNGRSHLEPVSGIFILHGEKVDISDNRILNNGPRTTADNVNASSGIRGGIVIGMSFENAFAQLLGEVEYKLYDGIPAANIQGNIVMQPLGQALFIITLGPVSVVGNHFTSQGTDAQLSPWTVVAGAVLIVNLGVSKDLVAFMLAPKLKALMRTDPGTIENKATTTGTASYKILYPLYLPSGNVLFANNQTLLDMRALKPNWALSSQFIFSLDDISYSGNQSECASLLDLVFTNTALWGITVRTNDNRFQEGITIARFSLFSFGLMNSATGNQATHCLQVNAPGAFLVEEHNKVLAFAQCDPAKQIITGYYLWKPGI